MASMTKDVIKELLEQYRQAMFNKNILGCGYGNAEVKVDGLAENVDAYEVLGEAMKALKCYPKKGEMYYELLFGIFIAEEEQPRKSFTAKYNISDVSYYRYRGQAIEALSEVYKSIAERKIA